MIIGNGDLARALKTVDKQKLVFFASGVSNSGETRLSEYEREKELLLKQHKNRHIVYFSSLAVFYSETQYTRHKLFMENLVKSNFDTYTIVRIGNITWGDNPHTIINFFRNKIKRGESFNIQTDTYRYLLDRDDFLHWMRMIPDWSCEMNLIGRRMKVEDIVEKYGYR